jgi:hypothetical protein
LEAENVKLVALNQVLSASGTLPFIEKGKMEQAAFTLYEWLLKEARPTNSKIDTETSLYDMLAYMILKGERLGFSFTTHLDNRTL